MRPSVSLHSVLILGSLCLFLLLFSRSYHGNLLISQISGQVANFANTLSCILTCFGFWSAYRDLKFLICLCVYLSQSYAPWEQELCLVHVAPPVPGWGPGIWQAVWTFVGMCQELLGRTSPASVAVPSCHLPDSATASPQAFCFQQQHVEISHLPMPLSQYSCCSVKL